MADSGCRGTARPDGTHRITSYNVCYTKLLRGNFTSAKTELYEPGLTEGKTVGMSTAASGVYSSIGGFLSGNGSVISASTLNPQTYFCIGTLIYTTYYSYQTGNWDQISTWTTDPSGTLVITSYSIHYTKLYEIKVMKSQSRFILRV